MQAENQSNNNNEQQQQTSDTSGITVNTERPSNTHIEFNGDNTTSDPNPQVETQPQNTTKQDNSSIQSVAEGINRVNQAEKELGEDLASRGIDFDAIGDEYELNGRLSEKTLQQLEKAGYPKSVIDNYIRGIEAEAQNFANALYNHVGANNNSDSWQSLCVQTIPMNSWKQSTE